MSNTSLRPARLVCSAVLMAIFMVLSLGAAAADAPGLAGKWKMVSITPDGGTVDWMLTVKHEGETWTATIGATAADTDTAPAKDVKVDGASLHMKTPYGGEYYDVDLKLDGDKLTGKWAGNGDGGASTGTRFADSAAK